MDGDAIENIEELETTLVQIVHGENEEAADHAAKALTGLVAARKAVTAASDD